MKRRFILISIGVLILLQFSLHADRIIAQKSYTKLCADSQHVLIMRASDTDSLQASGLYEKGDTLKRIYALNWFSSRLFISYSGKYLTRLYSATDSKDTVISFYNAGFLIKSYKLSDICDFYFLLPRTITTILWESNIFFSENRKDIDVQLALRTPQNEYFIFNCITGNIIASQRYLRYVVGFSLFIILITIALLNRFVLTRNKSKNAIIRS